MKSCFSYATVAACRCKLTTRCSSSRCFAKSGSQGALLSSSHGLTAGTGMPPGWVARNAERRKKSFLVTAGVQRQCTAQAGNSKAEAPSSSSSSLDGSNRSGSGSGPEAAPRLTGGRPCRHLSARLLTFDSRDAGRRHVAVQAKSSRSLWPAAIAVAGHVCKVHALLQRT